MLDYKRCCPTGRTCLRPLGTAIVVTDEAVTRREASKADSMVADHRANSPTSASCSCSLLLQHIHISAHTREESQGLEERMEIKPLPIYSLLPL